MLLTREAFFNESADVVSEDNKHVGVWDMNVKPVSQSSKTVHEELMNRNYESIF